MMRIHLNLIQETPQDAVLEDQGRVTKNSRIGGEVVIWTPNRVNHHRFGPKG